MTLIRRLISTLGVALTLVAALSLAAAGGAHRIVRGEVAQEAIVAVYGVSADICGQGQGKTAINGDCPVCHLLGAVVLPEPATGVLTAEVRFAADVVLTPSQRAIASPFDHGHNPRGPPVV